jgi:hypothetical protein
MSKVVVIFEFAGMTHKEYDAICDDLKERGLLYTEQRPSHVSFERDGKWCVVDVWNSAEVMMEFAQKGLIPAFQKLGLTPPQPIILPAYNYMGAEEEVTSA